MKDINFFPSDKLVVRFETSLRNELYTYVYVYKLVDYKKKQNQISKSYLVFFISFT